MKNETKQNIFFEEVKKQMEAYYKKMKEHQDKKMKIECDYGIHSEEWDNWWKEKEAIKCPFSSGVLKACRAWMYSDKEIIEVNEALWDMEIHDFIESFRNAGIASFVFTDTSTAVMDNIKGFIKALTSRIVMRRSIVSSFFSMISLISW